MLKKVNEIFTNVQWAMDHCKEFLITADIQNNPWRNLTVDFKCIRANEQNSNCSSSQTNVIVGSCKTLSLGNFHLQKIKIVQ